MYISDNQINTIYCHKNFDMFTRKPLKFDKTLIFAEFFGKK